MLKVVVGYLSPEDELTVVDRSLAGLAQVRQIIDLDELSALRERARQVYVDPALLALQCRLPVRHETPSRSA